MHSLFRAARVDRLFLPALSLWQSLTTWWRSQGLWWAVSVTAHSLVLSIVLLLMGSLTLPVTMEPEVVYVVDTTIAEPSELAPDLSLAPTAPPEPSIDINPPVGSAPASDLVSVDSGEIALRASGIELGDSAGSTMNDSIGLPDGAIGTDGIGPGRGTPFGTKTGRPAGAQGGSSFGFRKNHRGGGRTKAGDKSVAMALGWLARHQDPSGRWSLGEFSQHCLDPGCRCKAGSSDTAATAMGLLPFLATGETHRSKSKYRGTMQRGLYWLISAQKNDGDLRSGQGTMYAHGLATIALCEAYGMSNDDVLGNAAQRALNFIVSAQDSAGGGWRYEPRQPGDLSVAGWQLMALKSGMMAGLAVPSQTFEQAAKFVRSMGDDKGSFGYVGPTPTTTMTSVGLLCTQYLGGRKEDDVMRNGARILLAHLPAKDARNCYYWYYATQVMHNLQDSEWDVWNRQMRRVLVESQEKAGCAAGSWNPTGHPHADNGGRLMVTAFNTLTLEVYYRYLPLYKVRH